MNDKLFKEMLKKYMSSLIDNCANVCGKPNKPTTSLNTTINRPMPDSTINKPDLLDILSGNKPITDLELGLVDGQLVVIDRPEAITTNKPVKPITVKPLPELAIIDGQVVVINRPDASTMEDISEFLINRPNNTKPIRPDVVKPLPELAIIDGQVVVINNKPTVSGVYVNIGSSGQKLYFINGDEYISLIGFGLSYLNSIVSYLEDIDHSTVEFVVANNQLILISSEHSLIVASLDFGYMNGELVVIASDLFEFESNVNLSSITNITFPRNSKKTKNKKTQSIKMLKLIK